MALIDDLSGGIQIAMGRNPLVSYYSAYGYNPDVDATSAPEDIWNGGGLYTGFPDEIETLDVFSSSANDTSAGTGARTVRLYGRGATGLTQVEDVILNGTSHVTTSRSWTRMFLARVITAGSGATNAGQITVQHTTTTANVFAVMPVGTSRTNISAFTVPLDRRSPFNKYRASMSNTGNPTATARCRVSVMTREYGSSVWEQRRSIWIQNTAGSVEVRLDAAFMLPPGTDIIMRVESGASADNLSVTGSFEVFTVPL